jgi:methyl-accepting chemotaxis protein
MKLSLRAKLLGAFGLVLAALLLLGIVSIAKMGSIDDRASIVGAHALPKVEAITMIDAATMDFRGVQFALTAATTAAEERQFEEQLADRQREVASTFARFRRVASDAADLRYVDEVVEGWDDYRKRTADVGALARRGDTEAANRSLRKALPAYTAFQAEIDEWGGDAEVDARQQVEAAAATYRSGRALAVVLMAIAAVLAAGLAILISRTVTTGLRRVVDAADRVGAGDLTVDLGDVRSRDELGQLAAAFQRMVGQLRELVGSVTGTAEALSSASDQMASTSEETGRAVGEIANAVSDVATGAERQVRVVEQTREATDGVVRAVHESAENARLTAEAAGEARSVADAGVDAAREASQAMLEVRESTESVTRAIHELSTKSTEIGGIVETITGIAGQTNLLALNAAIEAARAGEQGKGFAVVAEEVRKLAEESQHAAESIAELVEQIQTETQRAVDVVEDGKRRTDAGVAVVEQTRDAFVRIGSAVGDVTGRVDAIAAAAQQIAADAARVQEGMGEVSAVAEQSSASTEEVSASTEQTSASTQQIAASAQELARTAEDLRVLVGRFELGDA